MKFPACLLPLLLASHAAAAADSLETRIKPIAEAHKGKIAVMVKNLETAEEFALNVDTPMPTASLIKLAIMAETYLQAKEKKVDLARMLTLTKDDKVQGAGILTQHFSDGLQLSLRDCVRLMIVYSDNTATNMVLDQVGIKNVNDRMEGFGFPHTKINAKVFKGSTTSVDPERTKQFGLGSTTARETVDLLEMIHRNKIAGEDECRIMLGHLKANDDKEMLVRFMPSTVAVAHKTGAVTAARTDAGIMFIPKGGESKQTIPVAVCVLTNDNDDKRWVLENAAQVTIANIGKAVYDHYLPKQPSN